MHLSFRGSIKKILTYLLVIRGSTTRQAFKKCVVLPLGVAKRGSKLATDTIKCTIYFHYLSMEGLYLFGSPVLFTFQSQSAVRFTTVLKDYILNSSAFFGVSMKCIQSKVRLKIDLY